MQTEEVSQTSNNLQAEGRWDEPEHDKFLQGTSPHTQLSWPTAKTGR